MTIISYDGRDDTETDRAARMKDLENLRKAKDTKKDKK